MNRTTAFIIIFIVVAIAAFVFLWVFVFSNIAYTTDAYVEGNQVVITPLHSGIVTSIHTDDTFLVKKGDILVELDKTDAEIELNLAKDRLGLTVRQICQTIHEVFAYQADKEVKTAEWIKAYQDFQHRQAVVNQGGVSIENWEHALAALRASYFSLKQTEALYEKALSFVQGTSISHHPDVLQSVNVLKKAWIKLFRSTLYSPVDGLVAQRKAQVGMKVKSGEPLMNVIPLDQIWVNANFKETQMRRMKIGQSVKLISDLYGREVIFRGTIVGLPGGAGNVFSLLPPQNLSGNWIKIVQRLPVRVALDPSTLHYPLRLGLSMEATVDLTDQEGGYVPANSLGAPLYTTSILKNEEEGVEEYIEEIIQSNVDPLLKQFIDHSFHLEDEEDLFT